MASYLQVSTTTDKRGVADSIAEALVEEKLAACVQVCEVRSRYTWKGRVEAAKEWLCVIKTKGSLYVRVEHRIKELHNYEVPEIIATPIAKGSADYLRWIDYELR